MSADLHIHIFEGVTEKDLARFFSNVLGSKHFNKYPDLSWDDPINDKIMETPNIWVGSVSWLKAMILGDSEKYIPEPVNAIHELVGEDLPVIDDAFIDKADKAMKGENKTCYALGGAEDVLAFLREHKGKQVFTISW